MRFEYTTTGPIGSRANLGLIVLQPDETIEAEMRKMLPEDGVALYVTRLESAPDVTPDTLALMGPKLADAARLLPPSVAFDAVGYGCTSGTSVIGAERVSAAVKSACMAAQVTNPMSGLVEACRALGISRLAFLTPYIASVSEGLRTALAVEGIGCAALGGFDEAEEAKVARIDGESIVAAATAVVQGADADAVFLSCTNLRSAHLIDALEADLEMPVLSSNQVLAWDMLRRADVRGAVPGRLGRLGSGPINPPTPQD